MVCLFIGVILYSSIKLLNTMTGWLLVFCLPLTERMRAWQMVKHRSHHWKLSDASKVGSCVMSRGPALTFRWITEMQVPFYSTCCHPFGDITGNLGKAGFSWIHSTERFKRCGWALNGFISDGIRGQVMIIIWFQNQIDLNQNARVTSSRHCSFEQLDKSLHMHKAHLCLLQRV